MPPGNAMRCGIIATGDRTGVTRTRDSHHQVSATTMATAASVTKGGSSIAANPITPAPRSLRSLRSPQPLRAAAGRPAVRALVASAVADHQRAALVARRRVGLLDPGPIAG